MALRMLFPDIDSGCLAFVLVFFFAAFISFQLVEDWQTKLVVSGFCMFFIFAAFALDAWKANRKNGEWTPARMGTRYLVSLA